MATFPSADALTVIAATGLEARAARNAMPHVRVIECGICLSRVDPAALGDVVISCGIAGALASDLPTGSVIVPDHVLTPAGTLLECDDAMVNGLDAAAQRLGRPPVRGALVTTRDLIAGGVRSAWARRGYVAVDMETGFVSASRVAAVRVVLDTPQRELSDAWLRPWTILLRPDAWSQIGWVLREAPRCAQLAASVLAEALRHESAHAKPAAKV
jgi:hypothetical protein